MMERPMKIDENAGLIRPMKRKTDPDVGPDAMMVMIRNDLDHLLKSNHTGKLARLDMGLFTLYQIKDKNGETLALSGPFLGSPHAVMGMEKLIALGAERIWVLGWCGSLQPDLRIGDLVIPTNAISEEGTSQHYPIAEKRPTSDKELGHVVEKALHRKGCPFKQGAIWTTDAPYRETQKKIKAFQGQGVLAVEMEMSALMTVAIYRGVKLTGLLVVSDELFDLKWHAGFSSPELKKASRFAGKLLLDVMSSMDGHLVSL
jgi:uridine phosphorylase